MEAKAVKVFAMPVRQALGLKKDPKDLPTLETALNRLYERGYAPLSVMAPGGDIIIGVCVKAFDPPQEQIPEDMLPEPPTAQDKPTQEMPEPEIIPKG